MKTVFELCAAAVFSIFAIQGALAQQVAPPLGGETTATAAPVAGLPQAEEKNWLMRSPLVDIGWPKIKMPTLRWKTEETADAAPGPLQSVTKATRNAMSRTRSAWNSTIDKMKVGPFRSQNASGEPGFFAKLFKPTPQEPQRSGAVADAIGQDRPDYR